MINNIKNANVIFVVMELSLESESCQRFLSFIRPFREPAFDFCLFSLSITISAWNWFSLGIRYLLFPFSSSLSWLCCTFFTLQRVGYKGNFATKAIFVLKIYIGKKGFRNRLFLRAILASSLIGNAVFLLLLGCKHFLICIMTSLGYKLHGIFWFCFSFSRYMEVTLFLLILSHSRQQKWVKYLIFRLILWPIRG